MVVSVDEAGLDDPATGVDNSVGDVLPLNVGSAPHRHDGGAVNRDRAVTEDSALAVDGNDDSVGYESVYPARRPARTWRALRRYQAAISARKSGSIPRS